MPFISIPEAVCESVTQHNYKKVGLLGTVFTMEKDFCKNPFLAEGIDVVVPSEEDMVLVNERISKELEYGIIKDSTREELADIVTKMRDRNGIEAVILGCTELPLILNSNNCPVNEEIRTKRRDFFSLSYQNCSCAGDQQ